MQNTLEALSHLILKDYMVIFIRYVPLFSHFTDEYKLKSKETKKQHPQHHRAEERIQTWSSRLSNSHSAPCWLLPKATSDYLAVLGILIMFCWYFCLVLVLNKNEGSP